MLIQCTIENFLSFKEKISFSMVSGRQRKHSNHILRPENINFVKALKAGVIYGANASGKSNFVKALDLIQELIVNGTESDNIINRKPFVLDGESKNRPSEFTFVFCVNGKCYSYGISFNENVIQKEWLFEILKTTEKKLFERKYEQKKSHYSFGNWIEVLSSEEKQFINFIAKGTRLNQPFLKESIDRQIDQFVDPYNWFKNSLQIIFPDTQLNIGRYLFDDKNFGKVKKLISLLEDFGTGIVDFELKEFELENKFPSDVIKDLEKNIPEKTLAYAVRAGGKEKIFIRRDENSSRLEGLQLVLKHRGFSPKNEIISIDPVDESDGTIRLIDLLPILDNPTNNSNVFIVDEFDRSIHPNLSYKFLQLFLEVIKSETQLIVTTHEENLLDLELLRRDEIWFVEKDYYGSSHLYSLEEFQPRYDKDIKKGYLQGRFGAIPILRTPEFCKGE